MLSGEVFSEAMVAGVCHLGPIVRGAAHRQWLALGLPQEHCRALLLVGRRATDDRSRASLRIQGSSVLSEDGMGRAGADGRARDYTCIERSRLLLTQKLIERAETACF